jgi:hypothetical protein
MGWTLLRLVGSAAEWTDVRIFATRLSLASGRGRRDGKTKRKVGAAFHRSNQRSERVRSGFVYISQLVPRRRSSRDCLRQTSTNITSTIHRYPPDIRHWIYPEDLPFILYLHRYCHSVIDRLNFTLTYLQHSQ